MSTEEAEEYNFVNIQKRKLNYLKKLAEKLLDRKITDDRFLLGESDRTSNIHTPLGTIETNKHEFQKAAGPRKSGEITF